MGNPLPVELSSFNVVLIGSEVLLKWTTATEINNFGFDVERTNGLNGPGEYWNKIGFVAGNGKIKSPKDYSFIDNPLEGNKYFYRLKQIDNDGQYEYSNVISIDLNTPNKYAMYQNYPNPFNPYTTIGFSIPTSPFNPSPYQGEGNRERLITLTVYDVLGRKVAILVNEEKPAGSYEVEFNASQLPSGVYFYRLKAGEYVETKKMLLIK